VAPARRTSYHDSHRPYGRQVVRLLEPEALEHDGEQQGEAPQRDEHRHVEAGGACAGRPRAAQSAHLLPLRQVRAPAAAGRA
jgi:hypothetical protein